MLQLGRPHRFLLRRIVAKPRVKCQAPEHAQHAGNKKRDSPALDLAEPLKPRGLTERQLCGVDAASDGTEYQWRKCGAAAGTQPHDSAGTRSLGDRQPARL